MPKLPPGFRQSWQLAAPLILSNLSVPLLGAVDTAVVGHLPGTYHLGAVALGAMVMSVLYFMFGFLRMGTTALAAQAYGADDRLELGAILLRGLVTAAALGSIALLLRPLILAGAERLFQPTALAATDMAGYLGIRLYGAPAALGNFVVLGWLLGLQNARRPLVVMLATNGINAALCIGLVWGVGLGVRGVAWATVTAEYLGFLIGLGLLVPLWRKVGVLPLARAHVLILERFQRLFRVNRDIFIRSLLLEAAFLVMTTLGSWQGEVILAANSILMNFFTAAAYGLDGFAHAAEAMVGRAVGAADPRAVAQSVRAAFYNAALLALVMTALFILAGPGVIRLMTDVPVIREATDRYLIWAMIVPFVSVWAFVYDGIFFGATRTAELRNGMIVALLIYLPLAALLPRYWGNHGLWLAFSLFLAARGIILGVIYQRSGAAGAFARI